MRGREDCREWLVVRCVGMLAHSAEKRKTPFEPFVRLNEQGTRGAGLGLAAARSIARAHGGDVVILDNNGGAHVRVTLPA